MSRFRSFTVALISTFLLAGTAFAGENPAVEKLKAAYKILKPQVASAQFSVKSAGAQFTKDAFAAKVVAMKALRQAIEAGKPLTAEQQKMVQKGFPDEYANVTIKVKLLPASDEQVRQLEADMNERVRKEKISVPADGAAHKFGLKDASEEMEGPGGAIVNAGATAWKIISDNKPVITTDKPKFANAIPAGKDWTALESWSAHPASLSGTIAVENIFGTPAEMTYVIKATYGGAFNGKGLYLANVTSYASAVNAWWGYNVNLGAEVGNPVNAGTRKNPKASLPLVLQYSVSTVLRAIQSGVTYTVLGDGTISQEK